MSDIASKSAATTAELEVRLADLTGQVDNLSAQLETERSRVASMEAEAESLTRKLQVSERQAAGLTEALESETLRSAESAAIKADEIARLTKSLQAEEAAGLIAFQHSEDLQAE
eukprot:scaffold350512_cov17-Prasinocladus_malaysianus.AAC.1